MAFKLRRRPSFRARQNAYPYQLDAVRAVQDRPYAALFHEQGLGKTKIGIDLILVWLSDDRVDTTIVVTKKGLIENWTNELAQHSYITPRILGRNRRENSIALNSPALVYLTNYEVIAANVDLIHDFLRTCRVAVLLDESHKIKNPESQLSRHFHSLAPHFARRVILTGTPVANRPYDLWSQIKFLDDGATLGSSFEEFKTRFDLPRGAASSNSDAYGRDLQAVWPAIRAFSVRETKTTAGIELPEKSIRSHIVEMEEKQAAIYAAYRDRMAHVLADGSAPILDDAAPVLKRLLRLVQCASNPGLVDSGYDAEPGKYHALLELCAAAEHRATKVVVWTSFVENVRWLMRKLSEYGAQAVHGRMSIEERNASLRRFKTSASARILIATPGAAKEGHTLSVATQAVFYDRTFSLDDYLQAQDRIHRISQTEPCQVVNLIARGTIDEWVDLLLGAKYCAAQLAQGDIGREAFETGFNDSLHSSLAQLLTPNAAAA